MTATPPPPQTDPATARRRGSLASCFPALAKHFDLAEAAAALVQPVDTPAAFVEACAKIGLEAEARTMMLEAIPRQPLPAILLLKDGEAAIAADAKVDALRVYWPDEDRFEWLDLDALGKIYGGACVFAKPRARAGAEDIAEQAAPPRGKRWFWQALFLAWPTYIYVVLGSVVINLLATVAPMYSMNVYDRVVPNGAIETLFVLSTGVLLVYAFDFAMRMLRGYFVDHAGKNVDALLASRIFDQVIRIRMESRPPTAGGFANNLREFETLREFFSSATVNTLVDLPFTLLFLALIWWIGGWLVLTPLVAIPVVMLVGLAIQIPLDRVVKQAMALGALRHGVLVETISALETIKAVGAGDRMQQRWEASVGASAEAAVKSRTWSSLAINFSMLAQNLTTMAMIVHGVYLFVEMQLSTGALIACTMLAGRAMAPVGQIAALLTRLKQSQASLQTLDQIMKLPQEGDPARRYLSRTGLTGDIEFRNVSFAYPGQGNEVLRNVSFSIRAGERVGIVGPIGSGKSSILKLILGMYAPKEGQILIGGADIRQLDPDDLRKHIGCVPQDVILFAGSVRENIAVGAPMAEDSDVLEAAQLAGVDEFVRQHPDGYNWPVGERGERLSGGQRQAIALSRALLLKPRVLAMDEPTSAMDQGSEQAMKIRLEEVLDARTLVLIAHRPSLLTLVNRLIVVDRGRIIADGPRERVLDALAKRRAPQAPGGGGRTVARVGD
ncbi:MAG: type I secretion system permease/ATPase [Azospirillum sp.]|nr:type I secretion system permease/ATPase [Azospirillum sp.]MCZ8124868.1 type I secretion system permease/ATPase [Magnetospirillum sp.]